MHVVKFLSSPALPPDRIGKWSAYCSLHTTDGQTRSAYKDTNTEQEAYDSIPELMQRLRDFISAEGLTEEPEFSCIDEGLQNGE